jgi:hypothetical protein
MLRLIAVNIRGLDRRGEDRDYFLQGKQVIVRHVANGKVFGLRKAIGLSRYQATAIAVDGSAVMYCPPPLGKSYLALCSAHSATASSQIVASSEDLISAGMPNLRYRAGMRRRNQQEALGGLIQGESIFFAIRRMLWPHLCTTGPIAKALFLKKQYEFQGFRRATGGERGTPILPVANP